MSTNKSETKLLKEKLIEEFPLTKKMQCDFDCYEATKRRYVIFFDAIVNSINIESLLNKFINSTKNICNHGPKTIIIVGYTDEEFKKEDLLFFNGVDTFIVYYLKNLKNNHIYFNNQRVFFFSVDWKKIINKFNKILKINN